jgi:hypothetical protein
VAAVSLLKPPLVVSEVKPPQKILESSRCMCTFRDALVLFVYDRAHSRRKQVNKSIISPLVPGPVHFFGKIRLNHSPATLAAKKKPNGPTKNWPTALMAGLVIFTHKSAGALAHRGLLLFTSFLRGCVLHKKCQAPPPGARPVFQSP